MRISFVVTTFPSLSETFILNQITGLMDAGCEITILAGERSSDTVVHEDVIRHGLLHHTRFLNAAVPPASGRGGRVARYLQCLCLLPVVLWRAPGPLLRSLNMMRYGREASSLDLFFTALAFLPSRRDDIIVCHGGANALRGLRMKELGLLTGKLVTVFHVEDLADMVEASFSDRLQQLFARGDLFLPVSDFARDRLVDLGCPERKIVVHRMGVDVRQFDVSARRRFGASALKVISVARLVEKKGIQYALEAMAMLKDVPYEYLIIGDGPLRPVLEDQARRLGVLKDVRFLGWQDSGVIRRYLKDADVFLAPSVTAQSGDKEGIPVVLMEAMASGLPVLTTANGAIRELVEDGRTGFLVPEKDPGRIAARLRALRQSPETAERTARAARQLIEEQFNIETLNQVLLRHFTRTAYEPQPE